MFDSLWLDIRFGLGQMRRRARLTAVIAVCLALGIGPNTAIFSLIKEAILRPLDVYQQERLVAIRNYQLDEDFYENPQSLAYPYFEELKQQGGAFTDIMAYSTFRASARLAAGSELVRVQTATSNFFQVLGRQEALVGRTFAPDAEEIPGRQPYAVLGHRFWQEKFAGDRQVVGQTVVLNGFDFEIIGVMGPTFTGLNLLYPPDVWVPVTMIGQIIPADPTRLTSFEHGWIKPYGRLADGVSIDQANAVLASIGRQLADRDPNTRAGYSFGAYSLASIDQVYSAKERFIQTGIGLGMVGLILMVACASVAVLLLARSTERHQEMAVRLAVGARRRRLLRQLLVESLMTSLLAGALGVLLAQWSFEVVPSLLPEIPGEARLALSPQIDAQVLVYTFGAVVVATLLFGLAPALQATRPQVHAILKDQPAPGGADVPTAKLRNTFLVVQLAASVLLLIIAGLAVQSLRRNADIDPGYYTDNILIFSTDLPLYGYSAGQLGHVGDQLQAALAEVPGVEAIVQTRTPPLGFDNTGGSVTALGPGMTAGTSVRIGYSRIGPGYFSTLGIDLLAGRGFTAQDRRGLAPVVVVNQALAQRLFPDQDPLGRFVDFHGPDAYQIVGVAANIANESLAAMDEPFLYVPLPERFTHALEFVLRTAGDPQALVPEAKEAIAAFNADIALNSFRTMESTLALAMMNAHILALLTGALGVLALVLAVIGVYGVVSYNVKLRRQEVGIRLALGAKPVGLVWLLVRSGMVLVLAGSALGQFAALAVTRLMEEIVPGMEGTDLSVFLGTPLLLVAVALAAVIWPAGRTVRIEPMQTLRYQ
ncbi:MAG: FtsX-like permease family protein [Candidatus Latescibacteria bacterium]|nr:FtsX-like permease family protein [Candidatus Latescibacterota bacterium]